MNGITTISASALLFNISDDLHQTQRQQKEGRTGAAQLVAVCPASIVWPFLKPSAKENLTRATNGSMLPGAEITVLIPRLRASQEPAAAERGNTHFDVQHENSGQRSLRCHGCLTSCVTIPEIEAAAASILAQGNVNPNLKWVFGWALASALDTYPHWWEHWQPQVLAHLAVVTLSEPSHNPESARMEGLSLNAAVLAQAAAVETPHLGEQVFILGSPFGCISERHFNNSIVVGWIANAVYADQGAKGQWMQPNSATPRSSHSETKSIQASTQESAYIRANNSGMQDGVMVSRLQRTVALVMLDARVLPGMEGGIVIKTDGSLVGILTLPMHIKSRPTQLEIPLVIPAGLFLNALARKLACSTMDDAPPGGAVPSSQSLPFEHLSSSLVSRSHQPPASLKCARGNWSRVLEGCCRHVVMVVTEGGAWASGVVFTSSGIVLTCRHLFKGTGQRPFQPGRHQTCKVCVISYGLGV